MVARSTLGSRYMLIGPYTVFVVLNVLQLALSTLVLASQVKTEADCPRRSAGICRVA